MKTIAKSKRKLELALTLKKLKSFTNDEIAEFFNVTRQAIEYHEAKEKKKK